MKQPLESESQFHAAIDICEQNAASDPEGFIPILADAHDDLSFLYEKEGKTWHYPLKRPQPQKRQLCAIQRIPYVSGS